MKKSKNCWTVYCHTTPSGKRYIGITSKKPEDRWKNGIGYDQETPFGKAIKKYKWENIKHEILDTNIDEFEAKCLEEYYIFSFSTFVGFNDCKGYNCTLGGDGQVGRKHTEEEKMKISESIKGEKNPYYGKHHTEESRRKNSEAHKGKTPWIKGKHHTEESRRKNSESNKGKTPWNKGKTGVQVSWNKGKTGLQVAWNKGIPQTEEAKMKISASKKGKHLVMIDGKRHYE